MTPILWTCPRLFKLIIVSTMFSAMGGCVTEGVTRVPPTARVQTVERVPATNPRVAKEFDPALTARPAEAAKQKSVDPNDITRADPCAANLQNIAGAILMYYATKQSLPEQLSEVTAFADVGSAVSFRCPQSGLTYAYSRDGLRAEGKSKVIVVYDAAASHNGHRWCILMAASNSIANRSLEVVAMPESTFRLYH